MINGDKDIIHDEKGWYFVYGPLWFVILVMIIAFIASLLKNNNSDDNVHNQFYDYEKIKSSNIICPQCGENNPKSAKFCNECGCALFEVFGKFCPNCGAKIMGKNAKHCPECGIKLNSEQ